MSKVRFAADQGKSQMDAYMPLFNDVEGLMGRAPGLVLVYEEEIADRAYAIWQARGGGHGHDRLDWFEAERQLVTAGSGP